MTGAAKKEPVRFGTYLLLDRLAVGGVSEVSEVWRASMPALGNSTRVLALKRVPYVAEDPEFGTLFTQKARVVLLLNHPGIAQHFEVGLTDGFFFVAMEYVAGKDLGQVLYRCRKNGTPLPMELGCHAIAQSAEALGYAHALKDESGKALGIVHQEVSPQNVLVGVDGNVKLIGWTPSRALTFRPSRPGILRGKLGFLSPEQVRGERLDHRSDVFQLGLCLYEVLTRVRPFVGESDYAIVKNVLEGVVAPPRSHNPEIPEALEQVVLKALAKNVDERFQRASELAEALKPFSSDRAALARFMTATFP